MEEAKRPIKTPIDGRGDGLRPNQRSCGIISTRAQIKEMNPMALRKGGKKEHHSERNGEILQDNPKSARQ